MSPDPVQAPRPSMPAREPALRAAAQQLEVQFIARMLADAGLGQSRSSFGGGVGEDQFASFLVQEQARAMVRAGGIGLAEHVFRNLNKEQAI